MTVYVDLLFGLNTVINYLLLRGSAAVSGCPAPPWRLLGAACLGGLYAAVCLLPGLESLQGLAGQTACGAGMLVAAFGWKRHTLRQGLFFLALSFAFGGAVLLLIQAVEPDCLLLGGRTYYAVSTPALLLLAGLGYGLAALVLAGCGTHTGGQIQPVTLSLGERSAQLRVLRDTGNTLRDPVSGQNVLVAGLPILQRLLPGSGITAAQLRDPAALMDRLSADYPQLRFRLIPYRAVGTEAGLLLALRCGLGWKGREQNILTAFSPTNIGEDGRFEGVWGGEFR